MEINVKVIRGDGGGENIERLELGTVETVMTLVNRFCFLNLLIFF